MNKTTYKPPIGTQNINPMEIARLLADAKTETAAKAIAAIFDLEYKVETKSEYNKSIDEFLKTVGNINGKQVKEIYNQYLEFCKDQNYTPKPQRGFSRYVNSERNCKIENISCSGVLHGFFVDKDNPAELPKFYSDANKTISEFIESQYFLKVFKTPDYNNQVNAIVYGVYCTFCKEHGYKPTNNITFGQIFTAIAGYRAVPRRINGIIRRVYIKAE